MRISRGLLWGAVWSLIACIAIVTVVPFANAWVGFAVAVAVVGCMGYGVALNLRAFTAVCDSNHSFTVTSRASRCPDCGQRYADITRLTGGAKPT